MWSTVDGLRTLKAGEALLVREAVLLMVGQLDRERHGDFACEPLGIDWFDQWDGFQRLWMLEQVAEALFTEAPPLSCAAMWEATVDAIFLQVAEQVTEEIDQTPNQVTWRSWVVDAFASQHGRPPKIDTGSSDESEWRILVTQVADTILGATAYQKAEAFRDGDIERSREFLARKALPPDYLERIPPLRSHAQAQQSIASIRSLLEKV